MDVKEEKDDIPKEALWKIVHSEKGGMLINE